MDLIESSLRRLRKRVSRFIAPSAALRNVQLLKAQIELRGLASKDIRTIRRTLQPLTRCQKERRRLQHSRRGRSRLGTGRLRRSG